MPPPWPAGSTCRRCRAPARGWTCLSFCLCHARPGRAPTARGLGGALDITAHRLDAPEADLLPDLAFALLHRLARTRDTPEAAIKTALAWRMREAGWPWGPPPVPHWGLARTNAPGRRHPAQ
ncbi:hypothetical protein RAA17_08225 [Komagataeibacter rhaeticus]|nr:hypothetical protein [Komagataeibacter rhaeticus]